MDTVGQSVWISVMISEKFSMLMARYPLNLKTELVPLLVSFRNSLSTLLIILDSSVLESVSVLVV